VTYFFLYLYSFSLTLLLSAYFPTISLLYFAPMMILCFYKFSLATSLWWALACGLTIDLFASETKLGFYALTYCLTTLILYRYKYQFFEDNFSTLPIMTFLFGFCTTLLSAILYSIVITPIPLSFKWLYHDLFWMPINDALYTIVAFTMPLKWLRGNRYLTLLFGLR
jgi:rod shape-determining protein MreD